MTTLYIYRTQVLFFIALLATLYVYFNVGQVPFYLDDFSSIVSNTAIQPPIDFARLYSEFPSRIATYVFFSAEYFFFEQNASYYHWVGLALHLIVSLVFYVLIRSLLNTLGLKQNNYFVFFAVTLFGVLPLNTQTVVYIVQQTTLLAAFWYLASLVIFIKLRTSKSLLQRTLWLFLLFVSTAIALRTKQNTFSLPVTILLIEWLFFGRYLKLIISSYLSIGFAITFLAFILYGLDISSLIVLIDDMTRETLEISRIDYFRTQAEVIGMYIVKYFYPYSLQLEYDTPIRHKWDMLSFVWLCFHLGIITLAVYVRKCMPMLTFGALFYYTAHLVESSFIPISDIAFEHRAYLPNIGLSLATTFLLFGFYTRLRNYLSKYVFILALGSVLLSASIASHARIAEWMDKIAFYESLSASVPSSPRVWATLGALYAENGKCPLAIPYINHSLRLYREEYGNEISLKPEVLNTISGCLRTLGMISVAEQLEDKLINNVRDPAKKLALLIQKAKRLIDGKNYPQVYPVLLSARELQTRNYWIEINLSIACYYIDDFECAVQYANSALQIKPEDELASKVRASAEKHIK